MRTALALLLLFILSLATHAATMTVTIDGKKVTVPVMMVKGKAYVDVVALMKLLGGKAAVAGNKVAITTKAAAAAPTAITKPAAAGTAQLPGDDGALDTVYIMNKDRPLYFRLKSVQFSTSQLVIGDSIYAPKADEKLLLLRFTVQNPNKDELFIRYDSLRFTAVDAMNVNHEGRVDWGDVKSNSPVALNLKPAQTIELYSAVIVPAKGQIPKLMVLPSSEGNGEVLRYNLRDKVAPLQAPIADPADATGATALTSVSAAMNTAYSLINYDLTVEKFAYVKTALGDLEPEEDGRFLLVTVVMKNKAPSNTFLRYDTLAPVLTSTDGEEIDYKDMLLAAANRSIGQDTKPGQEMRVRLVFSIPKDVTPKTLALKEGESRVYEFEVKE